MRSTTIVGALALSLVVSSAWAQKDRHDEVRSELLSKLIYTDITVELDETPARTALRHIKSLVGVSLIGRYDDDKVGYGIDPETPVTIRVTGQPALSVLEMILDQCGGPDPDEECTWQLRKGFVEVGTKERLNQASEVRMYPIQELLMDKPQFDNAPGLDIDAALGQSGTRSSGAGSGRGTGGGGGSRGAGGGSRNSGGGLFPPPDDEPDRTDDETFAQDIVDLIEETVEPNLWYSGSHSVTYTRGILVVRAPDYVQRQIGGYRFAVKPPNAKHPTRLIEFGKQRTRFGDS
jgi:hypothetical protein